VWASSNIFDSLSFLTVHSQCTLGGEANCAGFYSTLAAEQLADLGAEDCCGIGGGGGGCIMEDTQAKANRQRRTLN
jgi:hypothetical protein